MLETVVCDWSPQSSGWVLHVNHTVLLSALANMSIILLAVPLKCHGKEIHFSTFPQECLKDWCWIPSLCHIHYLSRPYYSIRQIKEDFIFFARLSLICTWGGQWAVFNATFKLRGIQYWFLAFFSPLHTETFPDSWNLNIMHSRWLDSRGL